MNNPLIMFKNYYLKLLLLFIISTKTYSQEFYFLKGYVLDQNNAAIVGANIRVVDENLGTTTDKNGYYEVKLIAGLHRLYITHTGYKDEISEQNLNSNLQKDFYLEIDQKKLDEIVVKIKRKDYSYEIIQNLIDNKSKHLNQYENYKSEVYIKSIETYKKIVNRQNTKELEPEIEDLSKIVENEKPEKTKDTLKMTNMFECKLIKHENKAGDIKEERIAIKKIADQTSLYYKSATYGEFNPYKNHQKFPKIGDNEIVSFLSDLTFLSYKFQLIKSYFDKDQKVYQIKVSPRQLGNALYEGTIEVLDNEWLIKSFDLKLTKKALLLYDEFEIQQNYEKVENRWMPVYCNYRWKVKESGQKKEGNTEVIQQKFEFDLNLPKKFFGVEIGLTTAQAYNRDSTYWNQNRPKPLNKEESILVKEKDRMDEIMKSKPYLDSLDKIYNKITFSSFIYKGFGHINRSKKQTWFFDPIISIANPFGFGGWRIRYGAGYYKRLENRQQYRISGNFNYGISNNDLKGYANFWYLYNPLKVSSVSISVGSGFNSINSAATINDLFLRSNFYQNKFISINHNTELFNGFYLSSGFKNEKRYDFSGFKLSKLGDKISDKLPLEFPSSYLFQTHVGIHYTPKQLYSLEPNEKILLGSKFPTISLEWYRGWPLSNKTTSSYTYLAGSIYQKFAIGVLGVSEYKIHFGKFTDTTRLSVMDYKFQRGGDPYFFSPSMVSYQLIPQTFTTLGYVLETHYTHQFNGFFTSKIPILNKTKIREVAGGGYLYVPKKKYSYVETFAGINHVFKIGKDRIRIGSYYVISNSNQDGFRKGIKFSIELFNRNQNTWSF